MTTGVKNQVKLFDLPGPGAGTKYPKQIKLDVWDTAGQDEY